MARNPESTTNEPLTVGEIFIEAFVYLTLYLIGKNLWENELQPLLEDKLIPLLANLS